MRSSAARAALLSSAVLAAGLLVAPAATAAPAKAKVAPVVVASSDPVALVNKIVTLRPSLHLPAGTVVASWTLTFGDGTKTTTKGAVPHAVRHTYHKTFKASANLLVRSTSGATWSGGVTQTVTALMGHAINGVRPLRGLPVSISDDDADSAITVVRTDAKGFWFAPPNLRKASKGNYDVDVNSDARAASDATPMGLTNPRFPVADISPVKAGEGPFVTNLPVAVQATGQILTAAGAPDPAAVTFSIGAPHGKTNLFAVAETDGTGHYTVTLGLGTTYRVIAISNNGIGGPIYVTPTSTAPLTIPTITLTALS